MLIHCSLINHLFIHLFVCSFIHSCTCSFVHSFTRTAMKMFVKCCCCFFCSSSRAFFCTVSGKQIRFECNDCDKSYSTKTKLRFHQANIHGAGEYPGECPTICSICNKKLSSKSAKDEHEATVHMGMKRFQCDLCEKRFTRATFLYGHKRSHHSSLKLKCDKCQMTFSFIQSLREHQGQCGKSEGERTKHKCPQCDACFTTRRGAKLHETSSHGTAMHVCDKCGKLYRYKTSLRKHKKEKH